MPQGKREQGEQPETVIMPAGIMFLEEPGDFREREIFFHGRGKKLGFKIGTEAGGKQEGQGRHQPLFFLPVI